MVWLGVGWLLGIASTVVIGWINRFEDRCRVRRMIYREMARNYWQLSLIRSSLMIPPPYESLIGNDPKDVMEFGAIEHAKIKRDVFESLEDVVDIETVYAMFQRSRELSSDMQETLFRLNPVLTAFEWRVGRKYSKKILLAVSPRVIKKAIERISSGDKNQRKTE